MPRTPFGNVTKSIAGSLSWLQVLDALNIPHRPQVLPLGIDCPFCSSTMRLYHDAATGGSWFHCRPCGKHGDLVELASQVWQLPAHATLLKLKASGVEIDPELTQESRVQQYVTAHVDYRADVASLWGQAQHNLYGNDSTQWEGLQHLLGLSGKLELNRWQRGPGRLFGGLTTEAVYDVLQPQCMVVPPGRKARVNVSASRIFKGRGWKQVLAIPFYDLPGRISAFLFVGRQARPEDYILNCIYHGGQGAFEVGLAFTHTLETAETRWNHNVVVTDDVVAAMWIQWQHFHSNLDALPILGWQDRGKFKTWHGWQQLDTYKITFWANELDERVFHQASKLNANICLRGKKTRTRRRLNETVARYTSDGVVRNIIEQGKPWYVALNSHCAQLNDKELEEFLLRLQDRTDIRPLLDRCSRQVRGRADEILKPQLLQQKLITDNRELTERDSGWYYRTNQFDTPQLIVDGILRIDEVIHQDRLDQTWYRGRIIYEGEEVPFTELKTVIEKNPLKWMQDQLLIHSKGLLRFSPSWRSKIVPVALQFHKPAFRQGVDTIGWNAKQKEFVLPQFKIQYGTGLQRSPDPICPVEMPGNLPEPGIDLAELQPMVEHRHASLFWATLTAVLANITAPALNLKPCGIGLRGQGARAAADLVLKAIGGLEWPFGTSIKDLEKTVAVENSHNWPVLFDRNDGASALFHKWVLDNEEHNAMIPVSWWESRVLRINNGWHVIESDDTVDFTNEFYAVQKIVPSFMVKTPKVALSRIVEPWTRRSSLATPGAA